MRCQTSGYRERGGRLRLLIALVLRGLRGCEQIDFRSAVATRMRIPTNSATRSGGSRPPVPGENGHPQRGPEQGI